MTLRVIVVTYEEGVEAPLFVTEVKPEGPADELGIEGDPEGVTTTDVDDVVAAPDAVDSGQTVVVIVST